ncbi:hypothetical protein BST14_18625 [Mycobacterium arosiense ATCC BAA-1401 = DSM 45069]|uniref:DUF4189 domain-containing protein n=1 Tax=Mycobacterium arosiense ATCC BAA-1401 = DSM 45069 TaxID=1265311 RepID=A0A1W9ZBT1_MYCAI|nr:hypothetical protein BST14_18625 [Mycobacterium arosiense ATCC BAA-1401 = DSM 45069]
MLAGLGALIVAVPGLASAQPRYVGVVIGYGAAGLPQATSSVGASAQEASQGALLKCHERLATCALAATSTQCIGVAIGFGTKWMDAEGPDRRSAEANARARLAEMASDMSSDIPELPPVISSSCASD